MTVGNKVIVLGCSGSGKSTFAIKLREKTGLPLFHLDNIWWKSDRTHITERIGRAITPLSPTSSLSLTARTKATLTGTGRGLSG